MILLGMRKEVLSSKTIWLCSRCYTCTANCPQEVDFSNIMTVLRDMAEAEGFAPKGLSGRIERVSEAANALRADCINVMLGAGEATEKDVRAAADMLIHMTVTERDGGRT